MSFGVTPAIVADSGKRRVRTAVIPATAADHSAIHYFLTEVFGESNTSERMKLLAGGPIVPGENCPAFAAALEDPYYEPSDRLLLRRQGAIIAHVLLSQRVMRLGTLEIPVSGLGWLGTSPRCRGQGLGTHLLLAAEKQMAQSGALLGLLRTRRPGLFLRTGWTIYRGDNTRQAPAATLLARLIDRGVHAGRRRKLHIRPWRLWEEGALARVYRQNLATRYGSFERNRGYWHWLLEHRAFDQLYAALDGPNLWDLNETDTRLVGYAAVKEGTILELQSAPGRRRAALELLAHVCGDAIEQGRQNLLVHAPHDSPLIEIFDEAGGTPLRDPSEVTMARLVNPLGMLKALGGELLRRAVQGGLVRPLEFGILVDGDKFRLTFTGRGVRITTDSVGRSYVKLGTADFTLLVLGQLDWERALAEGRVAPSTIVARQTARVLFPPLPLWRPPWDDLMV